MRDHPKGLPVLFFTEMWERFSYYGMRAILVLYVTEQTISNNPGLGWSAAEALSLYGTYTMLVYLMAIPGGYVADKFLGQKKTVLIGGILIAAGQLVLIFQDITFFYTGLILLVLGVGALKPNISTMVGGLYKPGDPLRDKGFTIFYIGINIGAAFSPLIVGYIGEVYGWRYGFGLAGIGMLFGIAYYLWGHKHLTEVGNLIPVKKVDGKKQHQPLTRVEKDRIIVMLISFLIVIVFWGAYEQAGGLMNLYTKEKINRVVLGWEIPTSLFQSVPAFFVILLGTAVANFWLKRQKLGKETSSLFKMALGTMIMGTGFLMMTAATWQAEQTGQAMLVWLILSYLLQVIGELSASPVALSFITKLAPARYGSIMMGVYFAATGLGNKLAGFVGSLAENAGEFEVFTGIFIFTSAFGLLLLLLLKPLKRLTHGAEEMNPEPAT